MSSILYDNKYEFVKELGSGGFGKVFLAKEKISERLVAIKELLNKDKENQQGIIQEIQTVAKFNHQHIVTYHHHFFQDDFLYLVMEFCEGDSLRKVMKEKKNDASQIFLWIKKLADTLQFVHEKKIIHHDIKPDNILFTASGEIKISDFGIANTGAGTRAYMSPEALQWDRKSIDDARVDIYALGVTLLELLSGKNPFLVLSREQIFALHDKGDFSINNLPNWQQEIILKAINKVPELRFQSMNDFSEAIQSKQVPIVFKKDNIKAGDLAAKAERFIKLKKWFRAGSLLDYAIKDLPANVNVLRVAGKYFLLQQKISKARKYYEQALKLNPRLDVQKDLGWINLELKNYPIAISLLSDHLHRNPSDYEAYNLLLQCFYETNRYEAAMDLARTLLEVEENNSCFANNYYVCCAMHNIRQTIFPKTVLKAKTNEFIDYNYSVILESDLSHSYEKKPTLKSKLLFMDYRFNKLIDNKLYFTEPNLPDGKFEETEKKIIKFGRATIDANDIKVPGGTAISRRHCLIINCKDDVWLYDLESTGTYVNKEKVSGKIPLIGKNIIRIDKAEYTVTSDKTKLL
jgi:serine/threonine protein kinase